MGYADSIGLCLCLWDGGGKVEVKVDWGGRR